MKNLLKKVISSVAAVTMAVTIMGGVGSSTVFAADPSSNVTYDKANNTATYNGTNPAPGDGSITISNAKVGETYSIYRVFEATVSDDGKNVAYKYDGETLPSGFDTYFTLSNGYVTAKDAATGSDEATDANGKKYDSVGDASKGLVDTLKSWSATATPLAKVTTEKANDTDTETTRSLKFDKLPYGYYFVTSSVGSIVSVDTTNKTPTITDKNPVPSVDKKITKVDNAATENAITKGSVGNDGKNAIAEVGSHVYYEAAITVQKGATNYVFKDTMSTGLQLDTDSVKVYTRNGSTDAEVSASTESAKTFALDTTPKTDGTADENYTFKVTFDDSYLQGLIPEDATSATVVVKYSATVTSDALQKTPADNDARVDYGNNQTTTHSDTKVYNAKLTITKVDGNEEGLAGASFRLYKKDASGNKTYYKLENNVVSWVASTANPTVVEAKQTDSTGPYTATFTGLSDGTYYIEEAVTPTGYNTAEDQEITINDAKTTKTETIKNESVEVTPFSENNLERAATVINKSGAELPSTGGIGTTIFYVIGGVLIAGAAILLITRRKKA